MIAKVVIQPYRALERTFKVKELYQFTILSHSKGTKKYTNKLSRDIFEVFYQNSYSILITH